MATALALWYASDVHATTILVGGAIGGLALAIGLVVQVLRKPWTSVLIPRPWQLATTLIVAPIIAILGIELGKLAWHRLDLPVGFGDAKAIYVPRGVAARCELTIWLLPAGIASRVSLEKATHVWKETPYRVSGVQPSPEDRWLNGIGCSAAEAGIKEAILDALDHPGSMFRAEASSGFILLPSQNILVQSYAR